MPGEPLTGAATLFGKLPAHGDFVRRGDGEAVARLDRWLTGEVERRASADADALDAVLAALPTWCFVLADGSAGALAASSDRVGRVFPVVACRPGGRAVAEAVAERLTAGRDGGDDADRIAGAIAALPDPAAEGGADMADEAARWWRPFGPAPHALALAGLPMGADFARLLDEAN